MLQKTVTLEVERGLERVYVTVFAHEVPVMYQVHGREFVRVHKEGPLREVDIGQEFLRMTQKYTRLNDDPMARAFPGAEADFAKAVGVDESEVYGEAFAQSSQIDHSTVTPITKRAKEAA